MKITHDLHVHTTVSGCANETATVENYFKYAQERGIKKIGFADHFWDDSIPGEPSCYVVENYDALMTVKPKLEIFKNSGITAYFGCEAEYNPFTHGIAVSEAVAEQLDIIVAPHCHTHMLMPKDYFYTHNHVWYQIEAYKDIVTCDVSKYITTMAHPFDVICPPNGSTHTSEFMKSQISDDTFLKLFDMTAERGIAVELNTAQNDWFEMSDEEIAATQKVRMLKLALKAGCKFTIGSDSHGTSGFNRVELAERATDIIGITENDLADIAK